MIGAVLQADIEEIIRNKNWEELREAFSELDPSDIAEILIDVPPEDEGVIFRVLPRSMAATAFSYLPLDRQEELIHSLSNGQVQSILNEMTPDDRTRLLEELPAEVTRRLLETLTPTELKSARQLLGYPDRTAGRYMTPEYVALRPDLTAAEAIEQIRKTGRGKETLAIVYVLDKEGHLQADLRLGTIVLADPATKVSDIQDRPVVGVPAGASVDEVVTSFEKYDRVALPVLDSEGRMLGIITADDVLEFAQKEATEEIQRFGGTEALDSPYREVGFWVMMRKRGGWLAALFLGEMLTATAMGFFSKEIERAVVLAMFVPLIISSGGNSGSQATSIIIRSLALQQLRLRDWIYVFGREIRCGLGLGMVLGFIGFFRILLWQWVGFTDYGPHYLLVALTVWVALIGVVGFGTLAGSMLPFILRRIGFDPAASSAPFVATLVDVTGLCIYFYVAMLFLHTTLLRPMAAAAPTTSAVPGLVAPTH